MTGDRAAASTPKTLCFDLDGTLCTNTFGDYERAEPMPAAVDRVNRLARAGHRIVVFTARGTATGIDWREVTRRQLDRWGVDYDELHLGKPSADVYIDDRAVHTDAWLRGDVSSPPGLPHGFAGELPVPGAASATSVVEVGRTFGGAPLRLDAHIERLRVLATAAGVSGVASAVDIRSAVIETLDRAGEALPGSEGGDVVYAISLSAALSPIYLGTGQGPQPSRLQVACFSLAQPARALAGLLTGPGTPREDARIAVMAATREGHDSNMAAWPLESDGDGGVRDGLGGRLALVSGDRLALGDEGAIPSVASTWLGELAVGIDVSIEERPLSRDDIDGADEVMVIGAPWCLLPIGSVDGARVGDGVGPVTRRLLEAWSAAVGLDLGAQAAGLVVRPGAGHDEAQAAGSA